MLFRPSLPWGFAAGSGSILGNRSFSIGFRSYIREFLGAILMLFRPSLPWGFAAGSASILGDCLLKMPFSTEVVGAGAAAAGGNRRKKSLKSFNYIRGCLGAILMLCRPSLPWGFAAGSGSILGDCLLKMPFWTEGVAGAGAAAGGKTGGKSIWDCLLKIPFWTEKQ